MYNSYKFTDGKRCITVAGYDMTMRDAYKRAKVALGTGELRYIAAPGLYYDIAAQ